MLRNDIREDMRVLSEKRGVSVYSVCLKISSSKGAASKVAEQHNISAGFESLCEQLGYDIEFNYEDRVPEGRHVLNDVREDIKHLCWWKGTNLNQVAAARGVTPSGIYQMLRKDIVKRRYYEFCKELGYGIRIRYIPREEKDGRD